LAAQELIGFDGFLTLVDLSVEAEDFGQEVIFPEHSTALPNFDNPFIRARLHRHPAILPETMGGSLEELSPEVQAALPAWA
jgi:uroporphyrinogen-III decarboxylase